MFCFVLHTKHIPIPKKPRHGVAAAMMAVVASSVFSTKKVKALSVSIIYFQLQLFERRRVFSIL